MEGVEAVVGVGQTTSIANLRGVALLSQLSVLPKAELELFVAENPTVIAEMLAAPPRASEVVLWWESTAEAERATQKGRGSAPARPARRGWPAIQWSFIGIGGG